MNIIYSIPMWMVSSLRRLWQWLYIRLEQLTPQSYRFFGGMFTFKYLLLYCINKTNMYAKYVIKLTLTSGILFFSLLIFCLDQNAIAADNVNIGVSRFLIKYLGDKNIDKTTRYIVANIPDSNMIIAYIFGNFCGSGGCTLLIIEHKYGYYRLINKVTIVKLPIWLLGSSTNGRPDIGVWVQGGGMLNGYEALLAFDGKAYPSNPTVPPAQKLEAHNINNKYVLIPKGSTGELLFSSTP